MIACSSSLNPLSRLAAFAIGALMVLAAALIVAPQSVLPAASAAMGKACLNQAAPTSGEDDYGQIVGVEDPTDSTSDDLRGMRSDVWIVDSAECQRISSVSMLSPTGQGEFEFGYIVGWWGPSNCSGVDKDHFYVNPTLFNVRTQASTGSYSCRFWPNRHPTSGQYDTFRASDIDANTYWGSYFNGEELQPDGVNMDFARGSGVVNMERGNSNDSGAARFHEIEEYHDANAWTYFDDVSLYYDHDPDYHLATPDGHTANMVHD